MKRGGPKRRASFSLRLPRPANKKKARSVMRLAAMAHLLTLKRSRSASQAALSDAEYTPARVVSVAVSA